MRVPIVVIILGIFSSVARAAVYRVPEEYSTIRQAVKAARKGDTVRVGPGTYEEQLVLEQSIRLIGEDCKTCILKGDGSRNSTTIVTVVDSLHISGFTIRDAHNGIFVKSGASLEIEDCCIAGCLEDGIGFEPAFNTNLFMRNCFVTESGDGIDLESTQGMILSSRFVKNKDDGVDYDGDAGVLVYGCEFVDNKDDGIEIRIAKRTGAIILNSVLEGNGEDGIEIINSAKKDGIYNWLCVQNCRFKNNRRFGVGFVAHKIEAHTGEMLKTAVYAVGNIFSADGEGNVSPNYAPVFDAPQNYPKIVKATIERMGKKVSQELVVKMPLLVGVYNLRPTTDGTMVRDAEGVLVFGNRIYVADDEARAIFVLDRRTGAVVKAASTYPFPGGSYRAPGPEGLDVVPYKGKNALLLSDDEGMLLFTLSLEKDSFGHVFHRQDTSAIGKVEGIEQIGNQLILAADHNKLYRREAEDLQKGEEPIALTFEEFGSHIAGVGADKTVSHVFATLSGYGTEGTAGRRNHKGALFEIDPKLKKVHGFWHLGPFSNDPRGVSLSDGLVYVADGKSDFKDAETGEMNRGGIKVFVFLLDDSWKVLNKALPLLPVRYDVKVNSN